MEAGADRRARPVGAGPPAASAASARVAARSGGDGGRDGRTDGGGGGNSDSGGGGPSGGTGRPVGQWTRSLASGTSCVDPWDMEAEPCTIGPDRGGGAPPTRRSGTAVGQGPSPSSAAPLRVPRLADDAAAGGLVPLSNAAARRRPPVHAPLPAGGAQAPAPSPAGHARAPPSVGVGARGKRSTLNRAGVLWRTAYAHSYHGQESGAGSAGTPSSLHTRRASLIATAVRPHPVSHRSACGNSAPLDCGRN